ncbi:TonB-dependent receptor [Candidatus Binatus sp.]|uniref:TonB-dependent receptor n=1 Tax=Candidatus Binatus sp. TaxID=2811406 RepID=UPI002F91C499
MRRKLFLWISVAGILIQLAIQLAICEPASAADLKTSAATKYRITGVVKDALGRPIKQTALSMQASNGRIVAHSSSNDEGEFSFSVGARGTYAVVATKKGFRTATAIVTVLAKGAAPIVLAMEAEKSVSLAVAATRLNKSRNSLSPGTGGSKYTFSDKAIQQLPQGANTSLNQVILQAPGVAQDSYGQIHVRGDHADLQYRINGIQLPEGITGFGQVLSPRFAQSISLLTGALPAQYGLRTAGIVDIKTKDGQLDNLADVDFYGGQRGTMQPSFEYGGSKGNFSYFVTGQYLGTDHGVEPPTSGPTAIHDTSNQGSGFGYFSYLLSSTTRLSLITGTAINHFQIPANPNQPQVYALAGVPVYPSAKVRDNQFEQNYFNVLALQGAVGSNFDYQIAPFSRYSTVTFNPDHAGDLIYNGAASRVFRSDWGNGFQIDTAYHGVADHTFRLGGYFDAERAEIDNHESTFPANPITGKQSSPFPISIVDDLALQTWIYCGYLQDEWKLTKQLTFNYGVRFDLYDGLVRADQASPRAALVYTPFKGTTIHAGYARQFTPPPTELVSTTAIATFAHTTGAPFSKGNSTPAVERDHLFDAGVTQDIIPGLNVGIDSYYKKAADLIDEGQFGPALIFETFNYAKGRVWGVEFTSSYTHESFYAYNNFAYSVAQGTQVESGQFNFTRAELGYISSHYVFLDHDQTFTDSAGAAYNWRGWMFSIDGIYGSGLRSGFANTGNLPFYIQVDAGISRRVTVPNNYGVLEFRTAIVNMNDRTYQIRSGTGIGVFAAQYGPRRALYGGIKWELPFTKPAGT